MSALQDLINSTEFFRIFGFLALISLGVLLVLGFTNRIVVFNDGVDLGYCLGIVLVPVAAIFYLEAGAPHGEHDQIAKNAYYASTSVALTVWISVLIALGFAAATTVVSITHNGTLIVLPVALFKILTAVLVLAVITMYFFTGEKSKRRTFYQTVFFLGIVSWLVSCLVNGDRFRQRRDRSA